MSRVFVNFVYFIYKGGISLFFVSNRRVTALFVALTVASSTLWLTGCGDKGQQTAQTRASQVKAMKVLRQDTPLTSEFAGSIVGKDEVRVQSKVSGKVVEKYFHGGDFVTVGQPLYKIDSRQYESAVLQARANLSQAEATLNNARTDLYRDQELLASDAISEQTVTTQQAQVDAYAAAAAANAALLRKAQEDLDDTVVYSPLTGQLSVDDVAVGTYAVAGSTTLVTVGSSDPIYAQFSISESEYLRFMGIKNTPGQSVNPGITVILTLSDGTEYPLPGRLVEMDRSLADNTGSLTLKALFENPTGALLPGMFARVRLTGEVVPNAILVPERAVQQLLGKSFVMVVGDGNKSEAKTVTLGDKVGSYYIIREGLTADDMVVVEGLTNLQEGVDLNVTTVTAQDMGFSLNPDMRQYNPDKDNK
ncbi:MAG: efflux RND transporter periplasmic adaptor subunit [Selenomonadaceae bacterium]|nr:efflux RND transporter periplasmic adaptor subunit [Selenomonadaceae bacterium]